MRTLTYILAGGILLALAACGKPPPETSAPNGGLSAFGGTGNKALRVNAEVVSFSDVANASDPATFKTTYSASVRRNNNPVTDATVTFYRGPKKIEALHQSFGLYVAEEGGIPAGTVTIDVSAGSDFIK